MFVIIGLSSALREAVKIYQPVLFVNISQRGAGGRGKKKAISHHAALKTTDTKIATMQSVWDT